ncbi:RNA polymerase II C-terminal domain kinase beta subunit [Sporothrix eucalyptigena]|uniref:RNA polymerase II holoenzyme cyclin-like subunit n=1 Tax=Sporothrix eucalyptigena TaxID=1812306 RepID=A0ABP0CRU5_9PEZI
MGRRGPRRDGGGGGGGGGFRHGGPNNGARNSGGHNGPTQTPIPAPPPQAKIITEEYPPVKGPHPGFVTVASQYTLEQQLRQMQRDNGCDPSREDSYRLQGVQLIDSAREALRLPVKTFTTACTYYHKFRLNFRDAEYNFQDAALAALFVACKVEDTIKKAKDVLCAAYNLKNPDKPTTSDDKIFERPSAVIVGLDRLILQTVGFDFRVRYPQKLLIKLIRQLVPKGLDRDVLQIAYPMSIDMYKTFAPIKQTSFAMALAVIELTARVLGLDELASRVRNLTTTPGGHTASSDYHTNRGCVVETLLDLLDLYTQFHKSTKIGMRYPLQTFIDIKIKVNQEVDDTPNLNRTESACSKCGLEDSYAHSSTMHTPGSVTSPATTGSLPGTGAASAPAKPNQKKLEGTMRFLFDAEKMRQEQAEVAEYFKEEYTEEVTEVEEPIPELVRGGGNSGGGGGQQNNNNGSTHNQHNNQSNNRNQNQGQNQHHGHTRRERNSNNHHPGGNGDAGWGPYQRNRNNDRHSRPRKGGGHY